MHSINFPIELESIIDKVKQVNPIEYAKTRNYVDGAVTYLSPYISRGVISLKHVYNHIKTLNVSWEKNEKLIQELAWRSYWQSIWKSKGKGIFSDLKHHQTPVNSYEIPTAIVQEDTGISVVDEAIKQLYETGYMHNHMRMYVASICCNIAQCHWKAPAKWIYSLLLDGDLASNHLSWQWIAGSNSKKKYYANQDNINRFFYSDQKSTFLDKSYDELQSMNIPKKLQSYTSFQLNTKLPSTTNVDLSNCKTLIYNSYNIDPFWHEKEDFQRILLLEPSHFENYLVSDHSIDFILNLTTNIPNIKVYVSSFKELIKHISPENIIYKEHPLTGHYQGNGESEDDLCSVSGYFPSFFKFWKHCKKELKNDS